MTLGFPGDRSSTQSKIAPTSSPGKAFGSALRQYAPDLDCRWEVGEDRDFLTDLFVSGSPLSGYLPNAMLLHQATIRHDAYAGEFPLAMRRIVTRDGDSIGRIVIDWSGEATHCVDIAVAHAHRGGGTGTAMLRAWLTVSDALSRDAWLSVQIDNPAMRLYARLGFVARHTTAPTQVLAMVRHAGAAAA